MPQTFDLFDMLGASEPKEKEEKKPKGKKKEVKGTDAPSETENISETAETVVEDSTQMAEAVEEPVTEEPATENSTEKSTEETTETTDKKTSKKNADKAKDEKKYLYPFTLHYAGRNIDVSHIFEEGKEYTVEEITQALLHHQFYEFSGKVTYDYIESDNVLVPIFQQHKKG